MNLLIVDDEIFAIQGLLEDIQKEQLGLDKILTANCYAQAVNIFINHKVDILLCDIEMPFGSGLDLVEWVNSHYEKTECIFLTCHDEFDFARQAVKLNCLDYILKPATAETVNEVLKRAADHIKNCRKEDIYKQYGKMYFNNMSEHIGQQGDMMTGPQAVTRTEEYIAMHIDEDLSVELLAEKVFLSSAHLSRLFKKKHGMAVNDYITSERMKFARELLETTDLTVTMISAKSGYSNYSYFIKMFKKTYGNTPREFRQKLEQKGDS